MRGKHDCEFEYPACVRTFTSYSAKITRGEDTFVNEERTVPYYSVRRWPSGRVEVLFASFGDGMMCTPWGQCPSLARLALLSAIYSFWEPDYSDAMICGRVRVWMYVD